MPIQLNCKRLDEIVRVLGDRLDGDWVLVGGALAAIWLEPRRVTEDIDIISLSPGSGGRLELMEVAEDLGLPIEAVNSPADFFLERIPGWRDQLEFLADLPTTEDEELLGRRSALQARIE